MYRILAGAVIQNYFISTTKHLRVVCLFVLFYMKDMFVMWILLLILIIKTLNYQYK